MRTLIIAPSFLAVFAVAILTLGWLITAGGESAAIKNGANLPPWAFTGWVENYRPDPVKHPPGDAALREQIEELSRY